MALQRLHKVMASAGVGSRRACETLIAEGRVQVDGELVDVPGTQVDPEIAEIRVDGERLNQQRPHYYLLNKPRGVICSARARIDTPKAVDYAPTSARDIRLFTIGRLDVDSEGALILTNDGELCHMVTHPRFGIEKTYSVEVEGLPTEGTIEKMRRGAWLAEGRTSSLDVRLVARKAKGALLEIKLREGMKREIRRVCARHGHEVRRLKRICIGPVRLGSLAIGRTRPLTPTEIAALRESGDVVVRLGAPAAQGRKAARARGESPTAPRGKRVSSGKPGRRASSSKSGSKASSSRTGKKAAGSRSSAGKAGGTRGKSASVRGKAAGSRGKTGGSKATRGKATRGKSAGGKSAVRKSTRGKNSTGSKATRSKGSGAKPSGPRSGGAGKSVRRGKSAGGRLGGAKRGRPGAGGSRSR